MCYHHYTQHEFAEIETVDKKERVIRHVTDKDQESIKRARQPDT